MNNYHVEVHSRDRQVEHYLCLSCESNEQAIERITEFYAEKGQRLELWSDVSNDPAVPYYIFRITALENKPVVYIAGEYRPAYPI